ncbi:hypothetical protein ACROYT_G011444 [Oculina patagonica]
MIKVFGSYKPFMKPNNKILYVHRQSNHPPALLKNIPENINKRLTSISSNQKVFDEAIPPYQKALDESGYNHKLTYNPQPKRNRNRQRKIVWYNPPWNANVKTNLGRKFLNIIDRCFPNGHPLHKIFNKHTLKLSYSCMPNMKSIISSHNKAVLSDYHQSQTTQACNKECNCRKKDQCPLDGKCLSQNVVYQATVTTQTSSESYVGLATNFKDRYRNHTASFRHENKRNETELSKHVWTLQDTNKPFSIKWRIIKQCRPYNNINNKWISSFEADISSLVKRYDRDTRQWFFDDIDPWFHNPGNSRAYVLLGDPGVGKSVIAAVLAKRMGSVGHLGAAYFCRHNDGTRNDPRYLLGTIASQLCECNSQYNAIVRGEGRVRYLLHNSNLGIKELFTKLLQEPLAKCNLNQQRKLLIIDALDETEYKSREDFLDLIMHRFPLLPEWLVFFITSRPEDSVQFRLKKYNPCVKICAGNSDQQNVYQQHEQDIQTFLKKRIDFSRLSCTVEDISRKCHGLFLYAHYIVEELKLSVDSGKKLNQLSDLFPGDIDDFFLQNFKRVYGQVGHDLFKKLFGCAIVAPSPLPVSIISYILKREESNRDEHRDEQQVIDAVSQFVVLRTSDQTLTFLHNLIPAWLTNKNKASRKLLIDTKIAGEYLRKIFVEILSTVVNEQQPPCRLMDVDLEEYVSRVAIRFLCQNGEKDSLKAVFSSLTSYHFIERRMLSGRIEIYHLLEDLKLAAVRLPFEEVKKQKILQEILFVLESNVLVLLECPHLLQSCIRNASNAVREKLLIPEVSAPWLEWNVYALADPRIADMQCFATSSNKRTVAGAKGRSILFFDAATAEAVKGPFEISNDLINEIVRLEFSPDGKYIFFGRLDKWLSVERGYVEDFPQFSGNSHIYKWGVFTRDGQSIVVKRHFLSFPGTCQAKSCLFNLLALWAMTEIENSEDDAMSVSFYPKLLCSEPGVQIESLLDRLRMSENLDQSRETLVLFDPSCHYCCRLKELTNQGSSLAAVRQLVIELYPRIFDYQVWDLQTGMPVLQQIFSQEVQLNPFTYLCHVTYVASEWGLKMECSGIEKAISVCNIAAVNAVCCAFFGHIYFSRALELSWEINERRELGNLYKLEREIKLEREQLLKVEQEQRMQDQCWVQVQERVQERLMELKWLRYELTEKSLMRPRSKLRCLVPTGFKAFHHVAFKIGDYANIPKSFQDLVFDVNGDILTCVSPEMKWVIEAGDLLKIRLLQTGNQDHHFNYHGKPQHTIIKSKRFTFTNDDLYIVYSSEGSLHALSLQTGTVLTSVSGFNLNCFTKGSQVGYLFRSDTDERAIFLTNLFSPFKFISAAVVKLSVVGKSCAAMFCSSDTVISVSSDSMVTYTFKQTSANKDDVALISLLTASGSKALHVKTCVISPDGKLIATHQENDVKLYSFAESEVKFLHSVFESKCDFTIAHFAFSSDSTVLLFNIRDYRNSHFYQWDIQKNVFSASFESPGFLDAECCCLLSNRQELILCGEYEIEIWQYAEHSCRFLTRFSVEKPYNSVEFSQCAVSLDNQFLVCCIADVMLVYSLNSSDIHSSKRVLRGHLGKIEFCQFLKVNRYLISYGVDGMVFLWDINEAKAVEFATIAEGKDSIVSMVVSPEEDKAVCFTSSDRVYVIKLCALGPTLSLKPLMAPVKGKEATVETSLKLSEQITSSSQILLSSDEDDTFELLSSYDSEEDMDYDDLE